MKNLTTFLIIFFLTLTSTITLNLLTVFDVLNLDFYLLTTLRWLVLVLLVFYGTQQTSLTTWIFISMFIGIEIGYDFPDFSRNFKIVSTVFLKLIKTIIAPLLFGTLVVGIAGHSNLSQVGRMGLKTMSYFIFATLLALVIGLIAINISEAGVGVELPKDIKKTMQAKEQNWEDIVLHIFPENFAKSVANNEVLQVVIFSVLFAIGIAMLKNEKHKRTMIDFAESLSEVMFKFTQIIMYITPFAVASAIAATIADMGLGVLVNLLKLLGTLYVALIAFLSLVLLPIALILKVNVRKFIRAVSEPVSLAFATASSEAALPKAMRAMENFGVPRKIVAFVMPTGYSFNLDGTTLYLSLATIFVAQVAGKPFTFVEQFVILLTLLVTSKGVAGIPRASLVILLGTAKSFDLPEEPIFIILGIDALMDMARTSVNVVGNCLATVVIAKWEGEFNENYIPQDDQELVELNESTAH